MEFLKISSIISGAIGVVLANFFFIFAYIENKVRKRKDLSYILIAFFFLGSSMAAFGLAMLYYFNADAPFSRFWEQFMHLGLFVMTPVWVHFIYYYFFGKRFSPLIGSVYAACALCVVLTYSGTLLFVRGPGTPFKGCLSFTYGSFYAPVMALFFLTISYTFIRTLVSFKSSGQPTANKLFFVIGAAAAIVTGFKDILETWWTTPIPQLFPYGLLFAAFMHSLIVVLHVRDMDQEHERQRDVEHELSLAQNIQRHFVPPRFELDNWNYQLSAVNRPGQYLGGDFYKVVQYSPHEFLFFVGDVTGKGVGASLYMTFLFSYFNSIPGVASPDDLDEIVTKANLVMKENSRQNMFVTLFMGYADLKSRKLHYVNAGHPSPAFFTGPERKELVLLNASGMPLGIEAEQKFRHGTVSLHDQDLLCLYTDGLSDAFEQEGGISGEDHLHNLVKLRLYAAPAQIVDAVVGEYSRMPAREPLSDDYTLMVIKLKSPA